MLIECGGTRFISVEDVDGVLRLVSTDNSNAAVPVQFAQVRIGGNTGNEVDPWKHTVNHIDISIVGETQMEVPLAYGRYYYIGDDNQRHYFDVTEDTNAVWTKTLDVTADDIKNGTLKAYTGYNTETRTGTEVNEAFYITGFSANAETDNDTAQVRIDGVFKVSMAEPFTQAETIDIPYGYSYYPPTQKGFPETTLNRRLAQKVTYVFTTTKDEVTNEPVYWTVGNKQYQLYNMQEQPLTISGEIKISAHFDYWDQANTCPPIVAFNTGFSIWTKDYYTDGGIYADWAHTDSEQTVSGMDFRLDGNRSNTIIDLDAIEITKYIVDESGRLIALQTQNGSTGLSSTFNVYQNPDGNSRTGTPNYNSVIGINPAESVQKGNGSMPADGQFSAGNPGLYQGYGNRTSYQ